MSYDAEFFGIFKDFYIARLSRDLKIKYAFKSDKSTSAFFQIGQKFCYRIPDFSDSSDFYIGFKFQIFKNL